MAVNKRLLQGAAAAPGGITPSEHFGVVLYEGDGSTSHSINGGKFGAGAYFNSSGNITPSGLTSDQLGPNGEMSISWWMNTPINDATVAFICEGDTDSEYMVHLGGPSTRGMRIAFAAGTTNVLDVNNAFTANTWQHFVAIMTPTGNKLYRDGSLVASNTFSETRTDFSTFYIGSRRNSSLRFKGKLDQLRIFAKELSSSEVSTLYAETVETVESLDPLSEDTTDTLQVLGDSSCIATYRFENDETDLSGNYDGTGTEIQYAAGRYGQAASFNGGSSYITIPSSTNPLGFINNNFSYSLWINVTSGGEDDIIGNWNTGTASNNHFLMIFNGKLRMHLKGAGVGDSTGSISTNRWYHIVCTTDWTNGQFKYYINGSLDSTKTISTTAHSVSAANDLYIGTRSGSSPNFGGRIDQVRIFNKVLSAAEVITLYNENSLVASYRFEGNANDDTRNYDGSASNVTYEYGLNFTPDFVWIKDRIQAYTPNITDSTRGTSKQIFTAYTNAQDTTYTNRVTSFDTGGFTIGNDNYVNTNGNDFVAWCLKANGGTTSSNTDGTITSTVQANQDAGFSIVKYGGNGVQGSTIGHGLSAAPEVIIVKNTSQAVHWGVYHQSIGNGAFLTLNSTAAATTSQNVWWYTNPSSTVFTVGNPGFNNDSSGIDYIAYCFAPVEGFSKFGSYTGNGSANGPIVETGFEPAFLMIKGSSNTGSWLIWDNKRNTTNPKDKILQANSDAAEVTNSTFDVNFLSNGFQLIGTNTDCNGSGRTYIYMCFAADPDTEQPTVAKSFSTVSYTGTGATQSIEGLGFSPSLVWLKNDTYYSTFVYDTIRGATQTLYADSTTAQQIESGLTSFDNDGFTLGSTYFQNRSGDTYYAWAWKADDNEPTINTEGSIDSLVSANPNAGFSIVKYTGTGVNNATFGHGLSAAPEFVIFKALNVTDNWRVVHKDLANANGYLILNLTNGEFTALGGDGSIVRDGISATTITCTAGSSTSNNTNKSGDNYIAYCFHSVSGFSKIGSYTGNGTTNAITGLGFQPDWILIKDAGAAESWRLFDSVRNAPNTFFVDVGGAETTDYGFVSFDSDGFTLGNNWYSRVNQNAHTYIYMAFKIN